MMEILISEVMKMIIQRHKVCDVCDQFVGVNKRYYIIKSKNYLSSFAGSCSDNRTHHICEDCMGKIIKEIRKAEKRTETEE